VKGVGRNRVSTTKYSKHHKGAKKLFLPKHQEKYPYEMSSNIIINVHPKTYIDRTENNSSRGTAHNRMPAGKQDGNVMVPMKKHQILLSDHNKEGIKEFKEFAPSKDQSPIRRGSIAYQRVSLGTNIGLEIVIVEIVQNIGQSAQDSPGRKDGQKQIPSGQLVPPIPGGPTFHVLLSRKDGHIVKCHGDHWKPWVVFHKVQHRNRAFGFICPRKKGRRCTESEEKCILFEVSVSKNS
jgi:hypothetical protein